jgi:hypothetical protein
MCEGLIHLFGIQAPVTQQFSRQQKYGNFVSIARPSGRLEIDIDDIDGYALGARQRREIAQHFLA